MSNCDSVDTVTFHFSSTTNTIPQKSSKSCQFDMERMILQKQQLLQNYDRLKCVTAKLRNLLSANPTIMKKPANINEIEEIKALDKHWDWQIQLMTPQQNNCNETADELLASIKRQRWCHICCSAAKLWEQDELVEQNELLGKFFCSIECQLNYYDS